MKELLTTKNSRKRIVLLSFILLICCVKSYSVTIEDKEQLIAKILSDPMFPEYVHGAKLTANKSESNKVSTRYIAMLPGKTTEIPGIFSIIKRESPVYGTYDIFIYLDRSMDNPSVLKDIDWDQMQLKWTTFINRYWPGAHRITDWHNEIWRRSGDGTFTMQYALKEEQVEALQVTINVRLSDGKINGVSTQDSRYLLQGAVIPPAPSETNLIAATQLALKQKTPQKFTDYRFSVLRRKVGKKPGTQQIQFSDSGYLTAVDSDNKPYIIVFDYDEKTGTGTVSDVYPKSDLDNFRQKPLTQVSDTSPSWSADGKQLYFVSTRDAKDRSWWNRGTVAFLQALALNQVSTDNVQFLSPLKTTGGDYGLYDSPCVSPDGRYLAAKLGNDQGHLFILDLQKGILHIPERDPAWLDKTLDTAGASEKQSQYYKKFILQDGDQMQWISNGTQWLKDDNFLYAGWLNGKGNGIYLCKKVLSKPFQNWDILEIQRDKGDDVLPCLSSQEKVLSWAYQDPPQRKQKGEATTPETLQQWHFVTADFEAAKAGVSNLNQTDLPNEPASISWDEHTRRWLIVTVKNELLWVQNEAGKLTKAKVLAPLTWNDNKLHPTSAAVSPDGNHIALAAELEEPIVYSKTECVIHSMIFDWDGKSTSVKPLYDPSLNGMLRYIFPATNSQWAKVEGNLKKFGLQDVVDPDFATSSSAQSQVAP